MLLAFRTLPWISFDGNVGVRLLLFLPGDAFLEFTDNYWLFLLAELFLEFLDEYGSVFEAYSSL